MRMPREAGQIIFRAIVAEIVQQQKGVKLAGVAETEGTPQLDAGALDGGLGLHDPFYGPDGHDGSIAPVYVAMRGSAGITRVKGRIQPRAHRGTNGRRLRRK
jgi:hypothetical protein